MAATCKGIRVGVNEVARITWGCPQVSTWAFQRRVFELYAQPRVVAFNRTAVPQVPIGVNYVILCVGTEAEMSGILNKFRVEHGIYGVRVLARSHQLTSGCDSDGEIDNVIEMLKDDLDGCAREMKRLVRLNRSGSLFEGWPSAQDELVKG